MRLYHLVTNWDKTNYRNQAHFSPEHHADNWLNHFVKPPISDVVQVFFPDRHEFVLEDNGDDVYYVWHEADIMPTHPRFYELCKRIGLKHKIYSLPSCVDERRPGFLVAKASYLQGSKSVYDSMNNANYNAYFKYSSIHNDDLRIVIHNSWSDIYLFKQLIQFTHGPGLFHYIVKE